MNEQFNTGAENAAPTDKKVNSGKKGSKKQRSVKETKSGDMKARVAFVALIAAILIFAVLVICQRKIIHDVDRTGVVVALKDVPAGIVLDETNMQTYFGVELRNTEDIPAGYYTSGYPLVGKITARSFRAKEIVTSAGVVGETFYGEVSDGVEFSIEVDGPGQALGGSLRAGDIINVGVVVDMSYYLTKLEEEAKQYEDGLVDSTIAMATGERDFDDEMNDTEETEAEEEETGEEAQEQTDLSTDLSMEENRMPEGEGVYDGFDPTMQEVLSAYGAEDESYVWSASGRFAYIPVCKNVRVVNVYNASGQDTHTAELEGAKQVATIITVLIPRGMVDELALAMEDGTLRVSRVAEVEVPQENGADDAQDGTESTVAGESATDVGATDADTADAETDASDEAADGTDGTVDETAADTEGAVDETAAGVGENPSSASSDGERTGQNSRYVSRTIDVDELLSE